MRKTILLAVVACILGIVLLALLAFLIPRRLGQSAATAQSELFTGFTLSTEGSKDGALKEHQAENDSSGERPWRVVPDTSNSESYPNDTIPRSASGNDEPKQAKPSSRDETESLAQTEASGSGSEAESGERLRKLPESVASHQIIWVGDSRTLGLQNALGKTNRSDQDLFVGKVGEGIHWFRDEGMGQLHDMIEAYPGLPVVLNFGVNDPDLVNEYVVTYWDLIRSWPDTDFYILSVNPLDEEFLIEDGMVNEAVFATVNSLNVARMNVKLKEEFASRYIDTASFLKSNGFDTVDGLHFTRDTYLKIHDFVVNELFG